MGEESASRCSLEALSTLLAGFDSEDSDASMAATRCLMEPIRFAVSPADF
jgi:hypothetical protein